MTNRRERNMLLRYQKERRKNILAQPGAHDFVLILDQLKPGFNVAKIFRSAEAFGASAVHLIDIGPFDPAPAKGSFRKVPAVFHEDFNRCYELLTHQGFTLYRLAPDAPQSLCHCKLVKKSAFIFGHEEFGCSFKPQDYPAVQSLSIPQTGQVQSLNVSIAGAIVMYEYVRQHLRG